MAPTYQLVGKFLTSYGASETLNDACSLAPPKAIGGNVRAWINTMEAVEVEALRLQCASSLR